MGLLSSIASWLTRSMENPRRPLDPWSQALGDSLDGTVAASGVRVSLPRAVTSSGFLRGINLIAGTVAKLPLGVFKRLDPGAEPDTRHAAHRLLRRQPNPSMTAFVWKRLMQSQTLTHGNAYSYIARQVSGQPEELLPLDPDRTYPVRVDRELWYVHELKDGSKRKLPAADVLHFKGYSFDGLEGVSVVRHAAREVLGLDLGTRGYASSFFRNSARPNVAIKFPAKLSPEARRNLREGWERMYSGFDNAHRTAILEEGGDLAQMTINARDAQLLEARQFSLIEIANVLGIPPHKLGAAVNVSYKSLEQENQAYLDDAIDPWLVMWEEECEAKLLGVYQRDRETHGIAFDRFPLVRADLQQRGAYYVQGLSNGWLCGDDVRAREGMNPLPDGLGRVFYHPANLMPVNGDPDGPEGPAVAPGTRLIPLPDLRQEGDYDCGPAAVQSVCQHFGVGPSTRADYVERLGTTRTQGTRPAAILSFLSQLGLCVSAKAGLEVADLARFFAAGHPVLCPVQAGKEGATVGHWVAVTGTGLGQVMVQDPAAGPRMMSEEDWLARWQDADADGVRYERYGIAVGKELLAAPVAVGEPADGGEADADPEPDPTPEPSGENSRTAYRWLDTEAARMVRRLVHSCVRAAAKPESFLAHLDGLAAEHTGVVSGVLAEPLVAVRGRATEPELWADALIDYVRRSMLDLAGRVTKPDRLASWVESHGRTIEASMYDLDPLWRRKLCATSNDES